jgi:hypothetical protein
MEVPALLALPEGEAYNTDWLFPCNAVKRKSNAGKNRFILKVVL